MRASEELKARDEAWHKSLTSRDVRAVVDYMDEDFALLIMQPSKVVVPRERWLHDLPGYVVHEWRVDERIEEVTGDVGVIMQRVFMRATVAGNDRSGTFILSDIWRRRNGEWVVWRRHSTPLSAGDYPPGRT